MFILLVHAHDFKEKQHQWVSHVGGGPQTELLQAQHSKSTPGRKKSNCLLSLQGSCIQSKQASKQLLAVWRVHLLSLWAPPLRKALVGKEPLTQVVEEPYIEKMQEQQFCRPTAQIPIFGFSVALETVEARTKSVSAFKLYQLICFYENLMHASCIKLENRKVHT